MSVDATCASPPVETVPAVPLPVERRVRFDLEPASVHEVTPYAELYGVHPRDFVFGRGHCMIPAFNFVPVDVLAAYQWQGVEPGQEEIDDDDCACPDDSEDEDGGSFRDPDIWFLVS